MTNTVGKIFMNGRSQAVQLGQIFLQTLKILSKTLPAFWLGKATPFHISPV